MYKTALILAAVIISACSTENLPAKMAAAPAPSITNIAPGVWLHKSYMIVPPWGPVLSQGLFVVSGKELILIDTAWNDKDTESLLAMAKIETGMAVSKAVITHAHIDKIGGADFLRRRGIEMIAHQFTILDAELRGLTPPGEALPKSGAPDQPFTEKIAPGLYFYYPGGGHTRDNSVVYYEPARILFAGCLIRPGSSQSLGNTDDADIQNWAAAVRNAAESFPGAQIIIPSHGAPGGRELFDHTIALAQIAAEAPE